MFSRFFRRDNKRKKTEQPYDSRLIDRFRAEHRDLAKLLGIVHDAQEIQNSAKVKTTLKKLKTKILGHFMQEDVILYRYLKAYYKDEVASYEIICAFEAEIKDIQRAALKFFDKYTTPGAMYGPTFVREFEEIVEAIVLRVETEESNLYPLYVK